MIIISRQDAKNAKILCELSGFVGDVRHLVPN
jgi:hypothetical protein